MDGEKVLRCLSNSISRFLHLVSSRALKNMPCQKEYRDVANSLKLFKPILDHLAGFRVHLDEILCKDCEELDVAVNEAREFIENWAAHMSRIYCVVLSRQLILKIRSYSTKICQTVWRLLESASLSSSSTSTSTDLQHCIQEFESLKLESASEKIDEALKCLREGLVPCYEHLVEIIELLHFASSQELLKERIAVEKETMKANKSDQIDHIVGLVSHICQTMVKLESFKAINNVPIPSYFRCPLSLELMFDPVIVATGVTYERDSILKWLSHGLVICPVTRQMLSHKDLIPNYTVKALIANWCEENHIKVDKASEHPHKSQDATSQDLLHRNNDLEPSLQSSKSTSNSSREVGNGFERQNFEKSDHSSPEESCSHSRSGSTSTAVSSSDYQPSVSSSKHENLTELSVEMASDCQISSPSSKTSGFSPWFSGKIYYSSNRMEEKVSNGSSRSYPRSVSLPSVPSTNDLTTASHVERLVKDLKSVSSEVQTKASAELRSLAKHNMENRIIIAQCGAIEPLLSLLYCNVKLTQEHAVTALLNLSINGNVKSIIAEAGAIEPLIHVLKTGNAGAKENAAAALFSLSVLEEYRVKIGRSGAVKALVDLLGTGTLRGKKDAATALFNLSIFHENKARIIQAGAVKYLVELMDPTSEMVDKAVALLSNLSTVSEGCLAIAREGGIPLLVEVLETGSQRGKENAANILLQLCLSSPKYCRLVLQEGAVPPLVALSISGTTRAKEKAQQLLSHFRNQRESSMGRGKS